MLHRVVVHRVQLFPVRRSQVLPALDDVLSAHQPHRRSERGSRSAVHRLGEDHGATRGSEPFEPGLEQGTADALPTVTGVDLHLEESEVPVVPARQVHPQQPDRPSGLVALHRSLGRLGVPAVGDVGQQRSGRRDRPPGGVDAAGGLEDGDRARQVAGVEVVAVEPGERHRYRKAPGRPVPRPIIRLAPRRQGDRPRRGVMQAVGSWRQGSAARPMSRTWQT